MIHHGDLFDVLPTLPEASIDACVTDPPYGIGFMGREWDTFKPEKARASKAFAIGHGDKGRKDSINPNLRGRRQSPAMSPSQIEYNRSIDGQRAFQQWTEQWAREVHRVLKPGAYLVVCGAPRSYHRMACGLEDAGFVIRDKFSWLFGQGFPKNYNLGDGKGTALKPAHEPIALAWKPFNGSIKGCHAAHGTAALNIEACRIEAMDAESLAENWDRPTVSDMRGGNLMDSKAGGMPNRWEAPSGRWPSNVLLDEEAAAMLDEQSGEAPPSFRNARTTDPAGETWHLNRTDQRAFGYTDSGGASRFFYVAKPSREERDFGLYGEPVRGGAEQFDSRWKDGTGDDRKPIIRNVHPTVKPVELMRWLVKLVTPIGGTVLDPFAGSGTTGMACAYELRKFIGIEREAEYVAIAERRISACVPLFTDGERTA